MKIAARFSALALHVPTFGADQVARPRREGGEVDPVLLVRLLHPGGLEVLQDHLGERLLGAYSAPSSRKCVDQFIVLVHAQHAVGAKALDGERTGHADLLLVLVGLVVEVLKLGLGGDGRIDLLLPGDASLPPVGMSFFAASGQSVSPRAGSPIPATSS